MSLPGPYSHTHTKRIILWNLLRRLTPFYTLQRWFIRRSLYIGPYSLTYTQKMRLYHMMITVHIENHKCSLKPKTQSKKYYAQLVSERVNLTLSNGKADFMHIYCSHSFGFASHYQFEFGQCIVRCRRVYESFGRAKNQTRLRAYRVHYFEYSQNCESANKKKSIKN